MRSKSRCYQCHTLSANLIQTVQRSMSWKDIDIAAARLLRSWVRIPPGARIFVCCECRVLSGRGLCDELITRPEESYRLCCVVVCDLETSRIGAPYIYDISSLRVKGCNFFSVPRKQRERTLISADKEKWSDDATP